MNRLFAGAVCLTTFGVPSVASARSVRLLSIGAAVDLPPGWDRWVNDEGEGLVHSKAEVVVHLAAKGGNDCSAVDRGGRGALREHGGLLPGDWHPRLREVRDDTGVSDLVACRADRRGTVLAMVVFSGLAAETRDPSVITPLFEAIGKGLRTGWDKPGDVAVVQMLVHPTTGLEMLLPMHASSWGLSKTTPGALVWNGSTSPSVTLQIDDPDRLEICNEIFTRGDSDARRPNYVPGGWHVVVHEFSNGADFEAFTCSRTAKGVLSAAIQAPRRPDGLDAWPIAYLLDAAFLAAQY